MEERRFSGGWRVGWPLLLVGALLLELALGLGVLFRPLIIGMPRTIGLMVCTVWGLGIVYDMACRIVLSEDEIGLLLGGVWVKRCPYHRVCRVRYQPESKGLSYYAFEDSQGTLLFRAQIRHIQKKNVEEFKEIIKSRAPHIRFDWSA